MDDEVITKVKVELKYELEEYNGNANKGIIMDLKDTRAVQQIL